MENLNYLFFAKTERERWFSRIFFAKTIKSWWFPSKYTNLHFFTLICLRRQWHLFVVRSLCCQVLVDVCWLSNVEYRCRWLVLVTVCQVSIYRCWLLIFGVNFCSLLLLPLLVPLIFTCTKSTNNFSLYTICWASKKSKIEIELKPRDGEGGSGIE